MTFVRSQRSFLQQNQLVHTVVAFFVSFMSKLNTGTFVQCDLPCSLSVILFYLSVQFFHQCDVSRYGIDPEVFFSAGVKGEAIPHLLALRVGAVEAVDLRTWRKSSSPINSAKLCL